MEHESPRERRQAAGESYGLYYNWPRGTKNGFGESRKYNPPGNF